MLYVGIITGNGTLNITSKYADYANLTVDNFILEESGTDGAAQTEQYDWAGGCRAVAHKLVTQKTYNSQTGILTLSNNYIYAGLALGNFSWSEWRTVAINKVQKVYIKLGNVIDIS